MSKVFDIKSNHGIYYNKKYYNKYRHFLVSTTANSEFTYPCDMIEAANSVDRYINTQSASYGIDSTNALYYKFLSSTSTIKGYYSTKYLSNGGYVQLLLNNPSDEWVNFYLFQDTDEVDDTTIKSLLSNDYIFANETNWYPFLSSFPWAVCVSYRVTSAFELKFLSYYNGAITSSDIIYADVTSVNPRVDFNFKTRRDEDSYVLEVQYTITDGDLIKTDTFTRNLPFETYELYYRPRTAMTFGTTGNTDTSVYVVFLPILNFSYKLLSD